MLNLVQIIFILFIKTGKLVAIQGIIRNREPHDHNVFQLICFLNVLETQLKDVFVAQISYIKHIFNF